MNIFSKNDHRSSDQSTALKKKAWWSVYRYSLGSLAFVVLFVVGRFWFIYGNPPPQSLDELTMQTVDVVDWRINGSRLYVRLPSGVVQQVEFPSLDFKGPGLNLVIPLDAQKALIGQRCQMWGRPLRRVLDDRFQVFALNCDQGGELPFSVAKKRFEITFQVFSTSIAWLIFVPFLLAVVLSDYLGSKQISKKRGQS
jgi:hypothetical protein